jgi:hypothetical protein
MIRLFAWLALTCQVMAQNPPDLSRNAGVIRVKVVNSLNGHPVRKATVRLTADHYGGPMPAQLQGVTDASGSWMIRQMPTGRFRVSASHPAFPPSTFSMEAPIFAEITDAHNEAEVRVALQPGATISGKVTDADGNPMATSVVLWRRESSGLVHAGVASTDDQGAFHAYDLTPGRYYVQSRVMGVSPQDHPLMRLDEWNRKPKLSYVPTFFPNATSLEGATVLKLEAGSSISEVDFRLRPVPTVSLSGRLVFPPGAIRPSQGVVVQVFSANPSTPSWAPVSSASVPAGQDRFTVSSVPPGRYTLQAILQRNEQMLYARQDVTVGEEAIADLMVPLKSPIDIPIRKSLEPARDQSSSAGSPPMARTEADVRVWINPVAAMRYFPSPTIEETAEGTVLRGAYPGRYLAGSHNGYVKSIRLGGREITGDTFELSETDTGPLEVLVSNDWATLEGSVHGGSRQISVFLFRRASDGFRVANSSQMEGQRSFQMNVAPGEYKLLCMDLNEQIGWDRSSSLAWLASLGTTVKVQSGNQSSHSCNLTPAAEVERALKDALDKPPN